MASPATQGSPTPLINSSNGSPGEVNCQVQVENPVENGNMTTGDATNKLSVLESQIKTELNKRSSLRAMRLDISSTLNAYAVVLVLLASVTFVFYFQPPGGVDNDGFLNMIQTSGSATERRCSWSCIAAVIVSSSVSFHLAVTGILVCMSCIAFVIPSEDVYDLVDKSTGELGLSLMVTGESELYETLVDINKRVYLALRGAQILGNVANLFFIMSLWSSIFVAERSLYIVLPRDASIKAAVYNPIHAFSGICHLISSFYSSVLLWKVLNSALDLLTAPAKRTTLPVRRMVRIFINILMVAYFAFLLIISFNVIHIRYPAIK